MPNKIFDPDEMKLNSVDATWTVDQLLNQDGIFFLKDVAALLDIPTLEFKNHARKLIEKGGKLLGNYGYSQDLDPLAGQNDRIQTLFQNWWTCPDIARVDDDWDANDLMAQPGYFYLNDVCRKIPFTPRQVRYQLQKHEHAKEKFGVWKDPNLKSFVVDMPKFSAWIREVWNHATH